MARGFWTGLTHGAALSAAVLVVVSLLSPLPVPRAPGDDGRLANPDEAAPAADRMPMTAPETAPGMPQDAASDPLEAAPAQPEAADAPPPETRPITSPAEPRGQPDAEAVGLPVGSEFGRGGDIAPRLPAQLRAPADRLDQSDAPAVSAPAAEPAPVAITGSNARPEVPGDAAQPAQDLPAAGETAPAFERPQPLDSPLRRSVPDMALSGEADRSPAAPGPATPQPVAADPDAEAAQPGDETAPAADTGDAMRAPAMPAPALDLTLPPDLSDLRLRRED
ncbi:hypothetical protein [Paracoccus salsus]|uniref:hypothetical protein n=1 Tax=Paracoccus salsus TaxID=2911061 RepID=UPI001F390D0F|nr:hypothetical protein [Paracoccus salsus]MCF3972271.1 hypothetical protein [Paracoccus salsus]